MKKSGFTMIEMIITITIILIGIIGLFRALGNGVNTVGNTRASTIAINIAREGMELVYNIRDTNYTRWSGKKEQCWLAKDPFDNSTPDDCENIEWMGIGPYILTGKDNGGEIYYALTGVLTQTLNLEDGHSDEDRMYIMGLSGSDWVNMPGTDGSIQEGKFYRAIDGIGLYEKGNSPGPLTCTDGNEPIANGCVDGNIPKEYRFCSRVEYDGPGGLGAVKFCGVLTNFLK